jgi:hypothetical protein
MKLLPPRIFSEIKPQSGFTPLYYAEAAVGAIVTSH